MIKYLHFDSGNTQNTQTDTMTDKLYRLDEFYR